MFIFVYILINSMKKEAAIMAKEIEKRQKEYIEKQKLKQRMEEKSKYLNTGMLKIIILITNNLNLATVMLFMW